MSTASRKKAHVGKDSRTGMVTKKLKTTEVRDAPFLSSVKVAHRCWKLRERLFVFLDNLSDL